MLQYHPRCRRRVGDRKLESVSYLFIWRSEHMYFLFGNPVESNIISGIFIFQAERCPLRRNSAFIKNNHIIRVRSLFHVVCRKKNRQVFSASQVIYDLPQKTSCFRVESRGRLIQNQNLRLVQKCPCHIDSSSLTSRKLSDRSFHQIRKIQKFCELADAFFKFLSGNSVKRRSALQIVADRQVFVQHGVLKNNPDASLNAVSVFLVSFSLYIYLSAVLCKLPADDVDRR